MNHYIQILSEASGKHGELIVECLNHYSVYGLRELTEKQLKSFCKLKGLI
jgi:hypothetical protein